MFLLNTVAVLSETAVSIEFSRGRWFMNVWSVAYLQAEIWVVEGEVCENVCGLYVRCCRASGHDGIRARLSYKTQSILEDRS